MDQSYTEHHKKLCSALNLRDNSAYPAVTKAFLKKIAVLAHEKSIMINDESLKKEIEHLCTLFFDYCAGWHEHLAKSGGAKTSSKNDHADAARLKSEASSISGGLSVVSVQLACCEALLSAIGYSLDEEIKKASTGSSEEDKDIKWSYDLPQQIALMIKKRDVLSHDMMNIRTAKSIVEKLDFAFLFLEKEIGDLLDPDNAKKSIDEYTGLLRKYLYKEALNFLKDTAKKDLGRIFCFDRKVRRQKWDKVFEVTDLVTRCVQKCQNLLTGREEKLFLRLREINLTFDSMSAELEQARQFLKKHEVPEIKYRRDALDRQMEALQKLITLEGLVLLYEDVIKGSLFPMKTLKEVNEFQEKTLKKVYFITRNVTRDIEHIEAASLKFLQAPNPEAVPDDRLFENIK